MATIHRIERETRKSAGASRRFHRGERERE